MLIKSPLSPPMKNFYSSFQVLVEVSWKFETNYLSVSSFSSIDWNFKVCCSQSRWSLFRLSKMVDLLMATLFRVDSSSSVRNLDFQVMSSCSWLSLRLRLFLRLMAALTKSESSLMLDCRRNLAVSVDAFESLGSGSNSAPVPSTIHGWFSKVLKNDWDWDKLGTKFIKSG